MFAPRMFSAQTQPIAHSSRRSRTRRMERTGFTLLEVLIATTITLLMMLSLAKIFNVIGASMKQGRAVLELNNRLRNVTDRLRLDLDNLTAIPNPPANPASATGYFKYYDGSLTDYTAGQYSAANPNDIEDLSRFGDVDDILMFTARARAGDAWFTGKVPLFVLQGAVPAVNNLSLVTIAAQHAEIAVFVEPVVSNVNNDARSPNFLFADPTRFEGIVTPAGIATLPARYRLYYRTLLIRPDLNLAASGELPSGIVAGGSYLLARPSLVDVGGTAVNLPTPTCDMIGPHSQCDLSIRRVVPTVTTSTVAANSLEDLLNPANRFAHVQIPLTAGTFSMPILALSPKLAIPVTLVDAGSTGVSSPPLPLEFQSSFLHPAFTLSGDRTGEDVLASDILAFDIKGYDPSAPLVVSFGADGVPGSAGNNDPGSAGSDDILLSPNDAGFGAALAGIPLGTAVQVGSGEYVDLAWGWKVRTQSLAAIPNAANTWGQLSALDATTPPTNPLGRANPFTDALYRSGLALNTGAITLGNPPAIFQPAFDTWTTRYEGDGILQAEIAVANRRGVVQVTDTSASGPALRDGVWRGAPGAYAIDPGTDGIDNNIMMAENLGVDDLNEMETSAPFPVRLRGIRISVRMEETSTREVKQMSVAKEFVTQ